jgi:hypothetical protein
MIVVGFDGALLSDGVASVFGCLAEAADLERFDPFATALQGLLS